MSHQTVAHRWANQIGNLRTGENEFSSGSMFYENDVIYSYGHHFMIAVKFEDLVLFNSKGYSSSTSKHQGIVRGAVYGPKIIKAPFINGRYAGNIIKIAHEIIDFDHYVRTFNEIVPKLGNARKPELYLNQIEGLKNEILRLFEHFEGCKKYAVKKCPELKKILKFEFTEDLKIKMQIARKKELEKKALRKKQDQEDAQRSLLDWERLETNSTYNFRVLDINTAVRVGGDKLQTSKGVSVDLNDAVRIFKLWDAGKALGVSIKTSLGAEFKCTHANGAIIFGCHEVQYWQAKRVLTPYL
jgi:hypothetical protein